MIEPGGKNEIGRVVPFDCRDHLIDEFGIALGAILHLEQYPETSAAPGKDFVQGRDPGAREFAVEPFAGIKLLDLRKCHGGDRASAVGRAVAIWGMHEDELAGLGELDVD